MRIVVGSMSADTASSNPVADVAMDRYAAGDSAAFSELYDALAPQLYSFALAKTKDPARAEDLVQQTLLKMHCACASFVRGSYVTPWAMAILRHLFLDQARRKKIELPAADGEPGADRPSNHSGPEDRLEAKEIEQLVRGALSALPATQQSAFELVYYGQLTHAEAAELLGTTVASIKLRVSRAKQTIRAACDTAAARRHGP